MAKNEAKIKFTAETAEFNEALKTAGAKISVLNSELKLVDAQMDNAGISVEGLQKKHELLQQKLEQTTEKEKLLSDKLKVAVDIFGENSQEALKLTKELTNVQAYEEKIKKEIASCNTQIEEQSQAMNENADEAGKASKEAEKLGKSVKNAGDEAEKASKGGFTVFKGILADLASNAIQECIQGGKEFATECIELAASTKALNSQFEQTFGELQGEASLAISGIAEDANILETRLKGVGTSIYAFAKTSGAGPEEALGIMQRALIATADSAAYYDRSLEDTSESLMSFLKGNYENDTALGLSCTETTRNTVANELYEKSFKDLSETQKQLTLLTMVEEANKLSGAMGQAALEGKGWENVTGNLKEAWAQFQAIIGEPVMEALIPVIQNVTTKITTITGKVGGFIEKMKGSNAVADLFKNKLEKIFGEKTVDSVIGVMETIQKYAGPFFEEMQKAFDVLWDACETVWDSVGQPVWDMVCFVIESTADLFAEHMPAILGFFQDAIAGMKDTWENHLKPVFYVIKDVLENVLKPAFEFVWKTIIEPLVRNVFTAIIRLWEYSLKPVFDGICDFLLGKFKGDWELSLNGILNIVDGVFNGIYYIICSIMGFVEDVIFAAIDFIEDKFDVGLSAARNTVTGVFDEIHIVVCSVLDTVENAVGAAIDFIVEKFNIHSVMETVAYIFNNIKDAISGAINGAKDAVNTAIGNIKGIFDISGYVGTVRGVFNNIKNAIIEPINTAKTNIEAAIRKIKNAFDFEWSLPDIKLPHFTVSGGKAPWGFGGKGYLPSVSVEWYKEGGILTEATIFGMNGDRFLGGGEAGMEAVLPISLLEEYINNSMAKFVDLIPQIDYERLGVSVAQAIAQNPTRIFVSEREVGRVIQEYVGG